MQQLLEFIANHPFLWSAVAVVIAALIANEIWRSLRGDRPLPPSDAVRLINSRDAVVVDVRSAGDFKKGHLLNAINIPLAGITERANEISKNKECTILCYCAMGSTSQQACQRLQKLGYSHVHSLKGGINGWQAAGLPITRKVIGTTTTGAGLMADTDANSGRRVLVQKIYLRDASVEVPGGPSIFEGEWRPQIDVDLNFRVSDLGEQRHEVSVSVTVTAKRDDRTAYIVEVDQAGVFLVAGFDNPEEHQRILGAYCPSVLFPYVREVVGDLVQRAGFPHFLLQPMNFDALFEQHRRSQDADAAQPATH